MSMKKLSALLLVVVMLLSILAGCKPSVNTTPTTQQGNTPTGTKPQGSDPTGTKPQEIVVEKFEGDFIWKTSVSTMASNWNPHTYQTTDDSVPLDYTVSGMYSFIFNDGLHPIEGKEPYAGYVIVPEMAAEMPIDVTEEIKTQYPNFNIPESATKGYAYKLVLNQAACWSDGTPITAQTYVDSMERLFRPELLNYRASDWCGSSTLSIAGAEYYSNQGRTQYFTEVGLQVADLTLKDGAYYTSEGNPVYIAVGAPLADWLGGNSLAAYVGAYGDQYFGMTHWEALSGAANSDGYVVLTDETMGWILDVITANPNWGETADDLHNYLAYGLPYPETWNWEDVGVVALSEYELLIVLDKSLEGFYLLYNLSGLSNNLVKVDLYDSCLKMDVGVGGEEVWSSTYCTSLETSVSFGPYVISSFLPDQNMHFVKNENWWGYTDGQHIYQDPEDELYYPMYQTTEIDIQVVQESNVRKTMFMAGQLMSYGLQAADYATLRYSEYCYATPGTTIFFLILNGHKTSIENRENAADFDKAKFDLEMLTNTAFHQALGLSYDKDLFAATISPARSGAFGIIGKGYIYDPESGAQYRDTDQAKKVLCDFYGVDYTKYPTLDAAVDAITGFDVEQARAYFKQAFQEGIAAGYITDADGDGICDQTIQIEYALSSDSDFMTQTINYLNEKVQEVAEPTPFNGKIVFVKSAPYGSQWSEKIKEGLADTVLGGWSGSAMDPFGLTDLYTNPDYQYDAAWYDATKIDLTITVPVNGVDTAVTMTLRQWSNVLNGTAETVNGVEYNYGSGQADVEVRLNILAAIELKILQSYNYLPMLQDGSMALLTQQCFYIIEDYNPVMGRGGIAYTRYNYNEEAWAKFVADNGGELKY